MESTALLRAQAQVLRSMAEGVNVTNEDGVIVFTNPAFDAMFGYEVGELVGQHVSVLNAMPPEQSAALVAQIIEQLRSEGSYRGEFSNRRKDGSELTTTAAVSAIELEGSGHCWVTFQQDITERIRAESAVRESELRYRALFDGALDSIFLLEPSVPFGSSPTTASALDRMLLARAFCMSSARL